MKSQEELGYINEYVGNELETYKMLFKVAKEVDNKINQAYLEGNINALKQLQLLLQNKNYREVLQSDIHDEEMALG